MMVEDFIKELIDIRIKVYQKKEYVKNPNTFKLFFLIKEGLKNNVTLDSDLVSYAFYFNFNTNKYLSLTKNDTTKELMSNLGSDINDVLLKYLCEDKAIKMHKNNVLDEDNAYIYTFFIKLPHTRILK